MFAFQARRGRSPVYAARAVGCALGRLWQIPAPDAFPLPTTVGVLGIHRPDLDFVRGLSPGAVRVLEIIQENPAIGNALDELAAGWRNEVLVHGDIRWENCLILSPGLPAGRRQVWLIDWECAAFGDRSWDLACAVASYLTQWISGLTLGSGVAMTTCNDRFDLVRPAIAALLGPVEEHADTLRLAGARLLQTAVERSQFAVEISAPSVALLQVGANLITHPDDVAQLIGGTL
jgi:hypothetical protein